ncbi:unnamed protein product [Soboliphyme baturini]|uniref:HintN domain-containing protein n=1 Tax=Soboliphyme baturini TaxID=241478 RepID=A0A183IEU5_9BILA|nr:unnamed protein product [Soboliphyme baturini]
MNPSTFHALVTALVVALLPDKAFVASPDCALETNTVMFDSADLAWKTSCAMLTLADCLFFHESTQQCPCTCQVLRAEGRLLVKDLPRDFAIEYYKKMYPVYVGLPNTTAEYLEIETEDGKQISLTAKHLIYRTNCKILRQRSVVAEQVMVGDCVLIVHDNQFKGSRVRKINRVQKTGIYSPVTETGSLVVNDVLASCYSTLENESIQKLLYKGMEPEIDNIWEHIRRSLND